MIFGSKQLKWAVDHIEILKDFSCYSCLSITLVAFVGSWLNISSFYLSFSSIKPDDGNNKGGASFIRMVSYCFSSSSFREISHKKQTELFTGSYVNSCQALLTHLMLRNYFWQTDPEQGRRVCSVFLGGFFWINRHNMSLRKW